MGTPGNLWKFLCGISWNFMDIGKLTYSSGSWEFVGMNHQFDGDVDNQTWWYNGGIMV